MKTFEMDTSRNGSARIWIGAVAVAAALALSSVAWAQQAPADNSAPPAATTAPAPGADQNAAPAAPAETAPAAPAAGMQASAEGPAQNPYGITHLWNEGTWIDRGLLIVLGVMSLGTWYILF